jgi:hypothetical protein
MSLCAYIPIPPQTFSVLFCSCATIYVYIGTDSLQRQLHLTSASHVTAHGSTAMNLTSSGSVVRHLALFTVHFHREPPGTTFAYLTMFPFPAFRPRVRGVRRAPRWRGVAPADCSPASLDTGPVASTAQTDHSLLQTDILTIPSCPRGFDLVAGVTSKSTTSPSHLQHQSLFLCRYSNEIDGLTPACAEPHD